MKIHHLCCAAAICALEIVAAACKKDNNKNTDITVENISGTYKLSSLTWNHQGEITDVYNSLDECQKDDLLKLNPDLTLNFIDAGIKCSPPKDVEVAWHLSGDSLYMDDRVAKVESYDGTTLILTEYVGSNGIYDSSIVSTTTLKRQ